MALAVAPHVSAAYANLGAAADGKTLYFDAQAGLYRARIGVARGGRCSSDLRRD